MITIDINPTIFSLGHFHLRWYSIIVLAAIAAGLWVITREAERKGYLKEQIYDIAVWLLLGGLVGARLFHVIDHWTHEFAANPGRMIAVWEGGLAIWGAVAGGFFSLAFIARRRRWNFPHLLDTFAPGLVLGQAIGRFACIITGDAMGKPTPGPFGFAYANPDAMVPELGVYYTPTPVYEILMNLAIFTALWKLRQLRMPDGALFLIYLSLYSFGRFFITFASAYRDFLWGFNQAQVISLIGIILALPILMRMALMQKKLA